MVAHKVAADGSSERDHHQALGPVELEVWMGAVHATSPSAFAQLLNLAGSTIRHWLAGTKSPAPTVQQKLIDLSARIETAAQRAIAKGAIRVRASNVWDASVAARAASIAASGGLDLKIVVDPGLWSITDPDGKRREFVGQVLTLRTWITELLGHPPTRFRCDPSATNLAVGADARLLIDDQMYTLRREC